MPKPNNENAKKGQYRKYSEYLEYTIRGNKTIGNNVKDLKKLQKELKDLNKLIDGLYDKDDSGKYKPLKKEQLELLKQLYQKCDYYASRAERNMSGKKKLTETLLSQLRKVLKEDQEYVHCLSEGDTFPEKFRRHIVELDTQKLNENKVGGALSIRHPITYKDENGNDVHGFFTRSFSTHITKEQRAKWIAERNSLLMALNDDPSEENKKAFEEKEKEMWENPELKQAISNLGAGIPSECNVTDRNCAMTRIANVLGLGKLLADSHSMTIVDEKSGKKIDGVFMSTSKGTLFADLMLEPGYELAVKNVENGEENPYKEDKAHQEYAIDIKNKYLKKDLADMQILDFICGNVDRHQENMTYIIEDGCMTGVQGIDNDKSMGCLKPDPGIKKESLPALNDMYVISESVAKKVAGMTLESLDFILKGLQLSKEEIKAAYDRTVQVKNYIKHAQRYKKGVDFKGGKLTIVPDEEFADIDWDVLRTGKSTTYGNYFDDIYWMPYVLESTIKEDKDKKDRYENEKLTNKNAQKPKITLHHRKDEKTAIAYTDAKLTRLSFTEKVRNANLNSIEDFMKKLKDAAQGNVEGRKDRYKKVYYAAEDIKKWYEKYQEGITDKEELKKLFEDAAEKCQDYIGNHDPISTIGKKRQRIITEMMEFIGTKGIMLDDYYDYVSNRLDQVNQKRNAQDSDRDISTSHSINDLGKTSFRGM